ncbi:Cro/Cl family transcriptional regulator [Mannheimia granulomatis]|uniref:Transcriptional regulator n=1 Tax=Mannheimia granulomatis TaxID=85402 RepID=A0A011LWF0_9PAST|nr:helix-turn-helix domain-containing protein [Mannheimia granulomatis]EXI61503.1 transcriptional regulator [Mannheimia granulomatis]RGE48254.1 Cro/Cl family transcriptional regulator [Mannheimia granulomatis]
MQLHEYLESSERGEMARLSKAIKVAQPIVSFWVNGKRQVPAERCPEIEKFTEGKVTCEELRPDVNWAVLRNSGK